jgi:hypothetical protein
MYGFTSAGYSLVTSLARLICCTLPGSFLCFGNSYSDRNSIFTSWLYVYRFPGSLAPNSLLCHSQ